MKIEALILAGIVIGIIGLIYMIISNQPEKIAKSTTSRDGVDWDWLSASIRGGFSAGWNRFRSFLKVALPILGKVLKFLFLTRAGWVLIIVSVIAWNVMKVRSMTPIDFMVERNGIPTEILPWSGSLFQDWISPENNPSSTDGIAWKVVITRTGDSVTFIYKYMNGVQWKVADKFKFNNGGEYQTNDGRTVIFQSDNSGWSFIPK